MLEATLPEDEGSQLVDHYRAAGGSLPPFILESFLLRDAGSNVWRIVTIWASQDALDGYQASVETPEGVRLFRTAGAEPSLTVFEVMAHATQS